MNNEDLMRHFLGKLPKEEILDLLVFMTTKLVEGDEKALSDITHEIVTNVQAREIVAGKNNLENYEESHRTEIKKFIKEVMASK